MNGGCQARLRRVWSHPLVAPLKLEPLPISDGLHLALDHGKKSAPRDPAAGHPRCSQNEGGEDIRGGVDIHTPFRIFGMKWGKG